MKWPGRVIVWFCSLLAGVALFSVLVPFFWGGLWSFQLILGIFSPTMQFAFPAWCLYLPFVIALKSAEGVRSWIILAAGILVGPVWLTLWDGILILRGQTLEQIWRPDPLIGLGGRDAMIFSVIVGLPTSTFFLAALKLLYRRSASLAPLGTGRR